MEKAYDIKDLGKKLVAAGVIQAEDLAIDAYSVIKNWVKESALLSSTPLDNLAVPFIDQLDAIVLPQLDKIDGQVG